MPTALHAENTVELNGSPYKKVLDFDSFEVESAKTAPQKAALLRAEFKEMNIPVTNKIHICLSVFCEIINQINDLKSLEQIQRLFDDYMQLENVTFINGFHYDPEKFMSQIKIQGDMDACKSQMIRTINDPFIACVSILECLRSNFALLRQADVGKKLQVNKKIITRILLVLRNIIMERLQTVKPVQQKTLSEQIALKFPNIRNFLTTIMMAIVSYQGSEVHMDFDLTEKSETADFSLQIKDLIQMVNLDVMPQVAKEMIHKSLSFEARQFDFKNGNKVPPNCFCKMKIQNGDYFVYFCLADSADFQNEHIKCHYYCKSI